MEKKVEYSVKKFRGWYYVEKKTGNVKKYWNGSKWTANIVKAESYETYQLANQVKNQLSQ